MSAHLARHDHLVGRQLNRLVGNVLNIDGDVEPVLALRPLDRGLRHAAEREWGAGGEGGGSGESCKLPSDEVVGKRASGAARYICFSTGGTSTATVDTTRSTIIQLYM